MSSRSTDSQFAGDLLVPTWSVDYASYDLICSYLDLRASPKLYPQVSQYLLRIAASHPAPRGLQRWLAELRPGRIALAFLDVITRWIMPSHPWRFRLNAVIAVHECDADEYRRMMQATGSRASAWWVILLSTVRFCFAMLAGLGWLLVQSARYATTSARRLRREERLFGGRTVVVTGASRGLGLALVGRLLSLDARVLAVARDSDALQILRSQVASAGLDSRLHIVPADVAQAQSLGQALAAAGVDAGGVDVVVVNAGIKEMGELLRGGGAVERTFAVNLFGAFHTVMTFLDTWRRRGYGHVIVISSLGRWHGMLKTGAYNSSKAALSVLMESVAMDLAAEGNNRLRITSVEPGLIRTSMARPSGLQNLLSVDSQSAARAILQSAAAGRHVCRFPWLFTALTAVVTMMPVRMRAVFFKRLVQS